jgi:hypothetical protein
LGVGGAIAINLCGGLCLAGWLVFGGLEIPLRGQLFLWGLAVVLVGISAIEAILQTASMPDADDHANQGQ